MNVRADVRVFFLAVAGGFLGAWLFQRGPIREAQAASAGEVIRAGRLQIVDARGRVTVDLGPGAAGSAALWFCDQDQKPRLNLGLYEDGKPFLVLSNPAGQAQGIFRLAGPQDAPVLVMKKGGQDRMILGMDLPTGNDPSLMTIPPDGKRKDVFGKFRY